MNSTVSILLCAPLLVTGLAAQREAQETGPPKVGSRIPVEVSVEGLDDTLLQAASDAARGGDIGSSVRRSPVPVTPLDCAQRIADQADPGGCLTASSTARLGSLFPYPGDNNVFVPPAFVGGGQDNQATGPMSTVGGGGGPSFLGYGNTASGSWGTVAGGRSNLASGDWTTIAGGRSNLASGHWATIAGGRENIAANRGATVGGGRENTASGTWATVGGGRFNNAYGFYGATVGGGEGNTASAGWATVGGGYYNAASTVGAAVGGGTRNRAYAYFATVAGGYTNTASGNRATVGGGSNNFALGIRATVPGGDFNIARGDCSFAAGRRARADHDGAFVWGDSQNADKRSTSPDQFNVYCSGGARLFSNSAATTGVLLTPGGGSWSAVSDRASKENVEPVDGRAVLERVVALPLATWSYRAQDDSIRHMGPMAQDFHAAFGLGVSDKLIDTIDPDGVALAAIQGPNALVMEKDAEIAENKAEIEELRSRVERLEALTQAVLAK